MATNIVIPSNLGAMSPEQKASAYTQQRLAGFSDPAIRNAVSGAVGPQSDQDWNYLLQLSGYNDVAPDSLYRSPTSGNSLIAALRAGTPAQPAGSASSFSMLPNRVQPTPPPTPTTSERPYFLNQVTPFETPGVTGSQVAPSGGTVAAPPPGAKPIVGGTTITRALPNFASWVRDDLSPEEKAAAYNNYLARGFTDAELREAANKSFGGKQSDADWAYLTGLAKQQPGDLLPINNPYGFTKDVLQKAVSDWQKTRAPATAPAPAPVAAPVAPPVAAPIAPPVAAPIAAPAPAPAPVAAPVPAPAPAFVQPVSLETDDASYFNLMDAALPETAAQQPTAQRLTINADVSSMTPQQKANLYKSYLGSYSDADIRAAVEAQLGPQPDADWEFLRRLAAGNVEPEPQQQDDWMNLYQWNQF